MVVRAKNVNSKFLYYCLNSHIETSQRKAADNGTAQPNLSAKSIGKFVFPIPNEKEQMKVVELIESVDKNIENELCVLHKHTLAKNGLLQKLLLSTPN